MVVCSFLGGNNIFKSPNIWDSSNDIEKIQPIKKFKLLRIVVSGKNNLDIFCSYAIELTIKTKDDFNVIFTKQTYEIRENDKIKGISADFYDNIVEEDLFKCKFRVGLLNLNSNYYKEFSYIIFFRAV